MNKLYTDYLYYEFLTTFRDTFIIPKPQIRLGESIKYFTWADQTYREFMMGILQNLEPRRESKGAILYEELEEIAEIFFVSKGTMDIGYEINRIKKFVLRYHDKTVVGAYNCCFNKRSMFIYRCKSECIGYFIRKQNWMDIISEEPAIEGYIKANVTKDYVNNIRKKVIAVKDKHLQRLAKRKDLEQVYVISNKNEKGQPDGAIETIDANPESFEEKCDLDHHNGTCGLKIWNVCDRVGKILEAVD